MDIKAINLISPVHDAKSIEESLVGFISRIESLVGGKFTDVPHETLSAGGPVVLFVKSGGVEGIFRNLCEGVRGPFFILAPGANNSLPAAMEILAYIRSGGKEGEIIHGTPDYCATRLKSVSAASGALESVRGRRLGIIGKPSDWLISCGVDYAVVQKKLGVELVDIEMDELLSAIAAVGTSGHGLIEKFSGKWPGRAKSSVSGEIISALRICTALEKISLARGLSGFTIRCFDLLGTVKTTGCLALAIMNSGWSACGERFVAGCEGDVPAIISMFILNSITGAPSFMANPSSVDVSLGRAVFAHCTVPLSMTDKYVLDTHFESGIGVAVRGKIREGEATVFRIGSDIASHYAGAAKIVRNPEEKNLCRTQIELDFRSGTDYFLKNPLGNHHVVCQGDYTSEADDFMKMINFC